MANVVRYTGFVLWFLGLFPPSLALISVLALHAFSWPSSSTLASSWVNPLCPPAPLLGFYTKPLISFPSGLKSCKLPLVAFAFSACGSWLGFFCSLNSLQRASASLRSHLDSEHVSFTGSVAWALRHLASRQYFFRCVWSRYMCGCALCVGVGASVPVHTEARGRHWGTAISHSLLLPWAESSSEPGNCWF